VTGELSGRRAAEERGATGFTLCLEE